LGYNFYAGRSPRFIKIGAGEFQGFLLHDPAPAGNGVIEGMAVTVGNGVEDGKRVAVGKRVFAAFVSITIGEREGVRTTGCLKVVQAGTKIMPTIPKIRVVRFI
jgi:hypothetical protein